MKTKKLKQYIAIAAIALGPMAKADVIADADSAYAADNFDAAVELYTAALDSLGPSAERYYNLGNAYYRAGQPGMAVVSYERALRHDPTNADIAENLEFVNSRLTDRIETSDSFVSDSLDSISQTLHPNLWAVIALIAFVMALGGAAVYLFADGVMVRKTGFFGGIAAVVVVIVGCIFAWRSTRLVTSVDRAVIVKPSVILSTTPRQPKDRSEEAFLLHEGTMVTILDSISEPGDPTGQLKWYDVKAGTAHRAWIPSDAVVKI